MLNGLSVGSMIDALVPISRFNKGEANKIFDEVKKSGYKIVVKNNAPACVLITPEKYQEMLEIIEDHYLLSIAEQRIKTGSKKTYSFDEILAEHGTTEDELESVEVDFE
ncbi:MAG: Antitoxin RelF [Firmicutes bacterium ADurb.Bin193]|nr:MAG: Antitoxin RelF [Firmicutes bacterium ADurb.Bin193]